MQPSFHASLNRPGHESTFVNQNCTKQTCFSPFVLGEGIYKKSNYLVAKSTQPVAFAHAGYSLLACRSSLAASTLSLLWLSGRVCYTTNLRRNANSPPPSAIQGPDHVKAPALPASPPPQAPPPPSEVDKPLDVEAASGASRLNRYSHLLLLCLACCVCLNLNTLFPYNSHPSCKLHGPW